METKGLYFQIVDNHYWIEIKINKSLVESYRQLMGYDINKAVESDPEDSNTERVSERNIKKDY